MDETSLGYVSKTIVSFNSKTLSSTLLRRDNALVVFEQDLQSFFLSNSLAAAYSTYGSIVEIFETRLF